MATTSARVDHEAFFRKLATARQGMLVLDYDGTVAPFTTDRTRAHPYPAVRQLLSEIMQRGNTRMVVVTGRRALDIPALLQMENMPEIWGSHGLERIQLDGTCSLVPIEGSDREALAEARVFLDREGIAEHAEMKVGGIAVHWRGFSKAQVERIQSVARRVLLPLAERAHLKLLPFDGGVELRVRYPNKGTAVKTLMKEVNDSVAIAYLGDDLTDEDAFSALGAAGLSVLVRSEPRPTAAQLWLRPPDELVGFLSMWLTALGDYR